MRRKFMVIGFLFCSVLADAQQKEAPSPVELNMGNNRFGLQFLTDKKFSPETRFSFLTVTSFESGYKNNTDNLDFINNSQISYNIYKGVGAVAGLSVNSNSNVGLSPVVGLQYVFTNREILFVITPTYDLSRTKNIEGLTVIEYKPVLTKKIDLYSRFQAFYNYDTKYGQHERSYMQFRLGVGIQEYQFGLATNLDYYGPAKILKDNYGIFLRFNFR